MEEKKTFGQLLRASFKSEDTEEWLDVHFTRPIGLAFALLWNRFDIHPNVITVLSIFLGVAGGCMFYYTDLAHNLCGVALMMLANFCDSTDGQMARLTGKKTLIGRMLDGFAGDAWFAAAYLAIVFRLWHQTIPGTTVEWGVIGLALAVVAGIFSHSPQASLADYYRQIHLYFLLGREGSELDTYQQQRAVYESLARTDWVGRAFYFNYANYCRSQERRTPQFQRFFARVKERWPAAEDMPQSLRDEFRQGSRPLMAYTNLLTHNLRATVLYITALADCPWVYLLFEIVVLGVLYVYMHRRHEELCLNLYNQLGHGND